MTQSMDPRKLLESLGAKNSATELFEGSFDSLEVGFIAGEVKTALSREASGLCVRAQRGGQMGVVGSRDRSAEGLERLAVHVDNAIEVGDAVEYEFPEPAEPPVDEESLNLWDPATADLTMPDLVETGQEILGQLKEQHPEVVFDGKLRRSAGRHSLRNSRGVEVESRGTGFTFFVEANRTRDEDVLLDFEYVVAPSAAKANPQKIVDRLHERLTWARETVDLKPGRIPVLFTPAGSRVVWNPFLQGLSGKTVMLGTSPLRDRVGEAIFDPRIQVTDDGLLPGAFGSAPFDDEGVPRQTRVLVEDGVLRGFVHDLETAHATGQAPTGNGERGGATGKPNPGFSNLLVRGGETPLADLIKGIDYGLMVHMVMGMGQGNTLPGTFSNPLELGFLIENGEVKGRVKNVSIAGNVYELLKDGVGGISQEVEQTGGTTYLPWLLLDVNVVGKSS